MLFTIVCCVFSCLCRFPVVHAVITLGCQLHRLSVLGVRKPLSSCPLGLKCWWWFSSQNDSEWLQKLGYLGLHCYICKISTLCEFKGTVILHPPHLSALRDRSWLNSLILSVCISEGCCLLHHTNLFHPVVIGGLWQHPQRNQMIGKGHRQHRKLHYFHTGISRFLLRSMSAG